MSGAAEKRRLARWRERFEEDPEEVLRVVLDSDFWPKSLQETAWARYDDDTQHGNIVVAFSQDGDAWIQVISNPDEEELNMAHRYRTSFGGGQSPRTYAALKILALAIYLDNQEIPQQRAHPEG